MVHLAHQGVAGGEAGGSVAPDSDRTSLVVAEPALDRDPQPVRQHDVVADLGVEVEGYVGGIEGDVVFEQGGDPAVPPAGQRDVAVPEKTVVDHQERPGRNTVDRGLGSIHRGDDAGDRAVVLDLEAVDGIALVGHVADPEELVERKRRCRRGGQ